MPARRTLRYYLAAATISAAIGQGVEAQTYETPSDLDEGQYPLLLDGTLSGDGDLKEDNAPHSGLFRVDSIMGPWNAFKSDVHAKTGITFGGSWGVLYQNFSDPGAVNLATGTIDPGDEDAVGQKFTLNFSREMYRSGTPDALSFDLVIEDRGPISTDNPPLQAGIAAGSIVPTAATWGDFDLGITQAYIRQNLWNNRFQYTIGKIFAPNFVDAYPFFDDNRQFLNQSFSTSPTIASPLRGAGAVATYYPRDNFYVLGGVYSANSSDTGWTIDEVFDTGELFYQLEAGWSALARSGVPVQARGPMDSNNIHLTGWYKDSQPDQPNVTLQPQARGLAFNANMTIGDNLMWFFRAGMSEGWVNDRAISAGFGWRPHEQYSDLFGVGVGWVRPNSDVIVLEALQREQWNIESFYRFHLTPNLAITPDLQYIKNPTLNPDVDSLWVASLRARITF